MRRAYDNADAAASLYGAATMPPRHYCLRRYLRHCCDAHFPIFSQLIICSHLFPITLAFIFIADLYAAFDAAVFRH